MAIKTFQLKISSAEKTIFDGEALHLTSQNDAGPFDVLPDHATFVSLLNNVAVQYQDSQQQTQELHVHRGLLSVKANQVRVFVDL